MNLRLFSTPWARFAGSDGELMSGEKVSLPDDGILPRAMGDMPGTGRWNGATPERITRIPEACYWDLPLPRSGAQDEATWEAGRARTRIFLGDLPPRASQDDREAHPREAWLRWQIQRYAELADLSSSEDPTEARLDWGARRAWPSIAHQWRQDGQDEAEISLVVRIAQDRRLLGAMRSIERAPRRMLLRRHEQVKLSRIQEMDSTALRAYSRAPGSNAAQKAGSKQQLLAVVRQDTVDLVENRLLLWVLHRLSRMASAYCKRNNRHRASNRFQDVSRLGSDCSRMIGSPRLEEVNSLDIHLSAPTYCLQFEPRYRQVWRVYRLIRRQEQIEDDAWQWQASLWGTSARLIAGTMLLELPEWSESRQSMAYVRDEGTRGSWLDGPSAPGPFRTPFGKCHLVDLREIATLTGWIERGLPRTALTSGADFLLVWPGSRRLLFFWSAVATGDRDAGAGRLDRPALARRQQELADQTGWDAGALLFIACPEAAPESLDLLDAVQKVITLRVPRDCHSRWDEIRTGLELALEELHRG